MKYCKKLDVIEAIQFNGFDDYLKIFGWMKESGDTHALANEVQYRHPIMLFQTIKGTMAANPGDYIIKGNDGQFYSCRPHIETYDIAPLAMREGEG